MILFMVKINIIVKIIKNENDDLIISLPRWYSDRKRYCQPYGLVSIFSSGKVLLGFSTRNSQ